MIPGPAVTLQYAGHTAGCRHGGEFLSASCDHAHVACFHDHTNPLRLKNLLNGIGNLLREPLLEL